MQKWLKAIKNLYITFLYAYIKWLINITKKNKEKLRKEAGERYKNLSEEKKGVTIIVIELRIILKKKNKKVEYMRNYYLAHKK